MLKIISDLSKDCKLYYQRAGNVALLIKERTIVLEVQSTKCLQAKNTLLELLLYLAYPLLCLYVYIYQYWQYVVRFFS